LSTLHPIQLILQWLKAFKTIILSMANSLKELASRLNEPLKLHALLASNRLSNIANNLTSAIDVIGSSSDEPEGLERYLGEGPLEVFKSFQSTIDKLIERSGDEEFLISRLEELTDNIRLAIDVMRALKSMVESTNEDKYKILNFALDAVIDDLEIMVKRHEKLIALYRIP